MSNNDPGAFLRDLMGGWEKMAGGTAPGAAGMAAGMQQMTERALAAANLATRTDLADLAARVGTLEATLARIEAKIDAAAAATPPAAAPVPVARSAPEKPEKPGKRARKAAKPQE